MAKLVFITSGEIDYKLPGKTLYQSIQTASLGKNFPGLIFDAEKEVKKVAKNLKKPSLIITASSRQTIETARIFADFFKVEVRVDKNLLPLRFDIKKLMDEERFSKFGNRAFNCLRWSFLDAFFNNGLLDDNREIKRRFKLISKRYKDMNVLIVSHAFLIKLLEIYNLIGDRMYEDKAILTRLFSPNKPPMGRLECLEIQV